MLTVMIRAQRNQLNRGLIDAMANQLSMIPTNQHPLAIFNIAMGSYQFLDDIHAYYKKNIAISNAKRLVPEGIPRTNFHHEFVDFSGGKVAFEAPCYIIW